MIPHCPSICPLSTILWWHHWFCYQSNPYLAFQTLMILNAPSTFNLLILLLLVHNFVERRVKFSGMVIKIQAEICTNWLPNYSSTIQEPSMHIPIQFLPFLQVKSTLAYIPPIFWNGWSMVGFHSSCWLPMRCDFACATPEFWVKYYSTQNLVWWPNTLHSYTIAKLWFWAFQQCA